MRIKHVVCAAWNRRLHGEPCVGLVWVVAEYSKDPTKEANMATEAFKRGERLHIKLNYTKGIACPDPAVMAERWIALPSRALSRCDVT